MSLRLDHRTVPPLSGRKVGSRVGTPGEGGGEPRGAGWGTRHLVPKFLVTCRKPQGVGRGAGWGTPNDPEKAMGEDGAPHRTHTGEAL